jgi:hypothetical protein
MRSLYVQKTHAVAERLSNRSRHLDTRKRDFAAINGSLSREHVCAFSFPGYYVNNKQQNKSNFSYYATIISVSIILHTRRSLLTNRPHLSTCAYRHNELFDAPVASRMDFGS